MTRLILLFLFIPSVLFAQHSPRRVKKAVGANPLIIIDSVVVSHDDFQNVDPSTITSADVLTDTADTKPYGDAGKDGVIICETREYARKQFIRFFRKMSTRYDSLYSAAKSDSTFQYIINNKVKTGNYEGDLSIIDEKLFISLEIITADDLKNKYNTTGKTYGILIHSKIPPNLYHKHRHF